MSDRGYLRTGGCAQHSAIAFYAIMPPVNNAQLKTLRAIFAELPGTAIPWRRIESLFVALGARVVEGSGSRVRLELGGVVATFHRPHGAKEVKRYQVRDARLFLEQAGVKP